MCRVYPVFLRLDTVQWKLPCIRRCIEREGRVYSQKEIARNITGFFCGVFIVSLRNNNIDKDFIYNQIG